MRILFVTTDTIHHYHFLVEICKLQNSLNIDCIIEASKENYRYKTDSELDRLTESYETKKWKHIHRNFRNLVNRYDEFSDVNKKAYWEKFLNSQNYQFIFTYGVSKLESNVLNLFRQCSTEVYNFHGGYLEEYRGLDTNLWALWHRQYEQIAVTIHELEAKLDSGRIIKEEKILIDPSKNYPERLRSKSVEKFIELTNNLITEYPNHNIGSRLPAKLGRYYSAMPESLKLDLLQRA